MTQLAQHVYYKKHNLMIYVSIHFLEVEDSKLYTIRFLLFLKKKKYDTFASLRHIYDLFYKLEVATIILIFI